MSRSKFDWWPYVKGMIRRYPALKAELEDLQATKVTVNFDAVGHGSDISNPTEQAALKQLPKRKQEEYDAVRQALEVIEKFPNGKDQKKMIELIFWKRTHNLQGVAMTLNYAWITVATWHREFIRLVAKFYGFLE